MMNFMLSILRVCRAAVLPATLALAAALAASDGPLTSLRPPGSTVEFLRPGAALGAPLVRYRFEAEAWRELAPSAPSPDLAVSTHVRPDGDVQRLVLTLENRTDRALQIGDLALPLPMHNRYAKDPEETFLRRVFRHARIAGSGSFVYWLPVGGAGPHLVMLPMEGTALEYFTDTAADYAWGGGDYTVFIHSGATGPVTRGTWRQAHTSRTLNPRGHSGDKVSYGFLLAWADDQTGVRELLYRHGNVDVQVVPGMVVPADLFALFSLRTMRRDLAVTAEHPRATEIQYLGENAKDVHIYKVRFSRLGENLVTVSWPGGAMPLEFFVTEPLETLIKKRAAFIAHKQQHRDPAKWYDGLFSLWDVRLPEGKNLLGPDNLAGQYPYAVSGSDDPSNSKCMFLSEKNVVFPDKAEIEALEYFIERFVWGKHQRTDKETPHPYGIYGCDSWLQCRTSATGLRSGGHGQERMWRTFDYTTYFALYYNMYLIAARFPELVTRLDARAYLERAFGTARAFFEVPYAIEMRGWAMNGWCDWAYKIGNFHEKYLLAIIDALQAEGEGAKAAMLRAEWEKKVRHFLHDDPHPWVSEMPVDSTAFESTYALARYALGRELPAAERLWFDKNAARWRSYGATDRARAADFMRRQLAANLACRGCLETSYYHLGSDFRGSGSGSYCLSYMSQMGGWAVLDHALRFADAPAEFVRLGYASLLSSWALVNSGPPEANHGFWHPGPLHDGAAAWGFMPQKLADEWNPACRPIPRGPWPVDGEIDHGLAAGIEAAATVVIDDPLFGLFAYGGTLSRERDEIRVLVRDGVRRRIHFLWDRARVHVELARDRFAAESPIAVARNFGRLAFALQNAAGTAHATTLSIEGLPPGAYTVHAGEAPAAEFEATARGVHALRLKVAPRGLTNVAIERK